MRNHHKINLMLNAPHVPLDKLCPEDLSLGFAYITDPDYAALMQGFLDDNPGSMAHIPGIYGPLNRSLKENTGRVFGLNQRGYDPEKHSYLDYMPFTRWPFPNLISNRNLKQELFSIAQASRQFCEAVLERVKPNINSRRFNVMVRHLYYPNAEHSERELEQREMAAHYDTSLFTISKFEMPGLQVYIDGQWQEIEPPERDEVFLLTGIEYGSPLAHRVPPLESERTVLTAFCGELFAPSLMKEARRKIAELQMAELLKI